MLQLLITFGIISIFRFTYVRNSKDLLK